jgi:hypothetical protein
MAADGNRRKRMSRSGDLLRGSVAQQRSTGYRHQHQNASEKKEGDSSGVLGWAIESNTSHHEEESSTEVCSQEYALSGMKGPTQTG